ncbi:hypothetical protein [Flexithrix dorotheae]|uniref:hypothetical protein n=1 Tax=Flexithrix dorotheae TaxID=70993 RepID=UPI0003703A7B|nr:hypothetical protein [Flexithrix dorotheae]
MKKLLLLIITTFLLSPAFSQKQRDYLYYIETFADNLLKHGLDNYGEKKTDLWAGVIDTRDFSVPKSGVPITEGVRAYDRAIGGSNIYHDVVTMKVFKILGELKNDPKYENAVKSYIKASLELTQNPETGLLGWGEHLYYNFYLDKVYTGPIEPIKVKKHYYDNMPHEFLAWTPPWEEFWEIDSVRTKKAIEGLKYHYQGNDPRTYLFNRHAYWHKTEHQNIVMPWIKHSVLYSYSYGFLGTKNPEWLYWSKHCGHLYWKLRDQETNLTLNCLYHPTETDAGKTTSLSNTGYASYWLYKTYEITGVEEHRAIAIALIEALHKYSWNAEEEYYYASVNLDGSMLPEPTMATPWKIGYRSSSHIPFGRISAYLGKKENNQSLKDIAEFTATSISKVPLPENFTAHNLGDAINLYMDVYDLTGKEEYVKAAKKIGDLAVESLWRNDFFVRENNDHYYEAKLGVGDLLAGLLRIYMVENQVEEYSAIDWSF